MDTNDIDLAILAYQHSLQLHPTPKVTPSHILRLSHPHTLKPLDP